MVTTDVLLGPIIGVPVGAAVLRAESALTGKLELAPNQRSPRVTAANPSASDIFPSDGSAVSGRITSFGWRLSVPNLSEEISEKLISLSIYQAV